MAQKKKFVVTISTHRRKKEKNTAHAPHLSSCYPPPNTTHSFLSFTTFTFLYTPFSPFIYFRFNSTSLDLMSLSSVFTLALVLKKVRFHIAWLGWARPS
jgi:hypothetical protein